MKKLLIVFVLFVSSHGFSQTSFGLKASYLIPTFNWNYKPINFNQSTAGASLGVVLERKLKDKVALQSELTFSVYNLNITENEWYYFNYLELPVLAKYYVTKGLNIYGGIKLGFCLNAGGGFANEIKKSDISTINVLFPIGIGYKFKFGFFGDLRYNVGLSNINAVDLPQFINNFNSLELGIGYFF